MPRRPKKPVEQSEVADAPPPAAPEAPTAPELPEVSLSDQAPASAADRILQQELEERQARALERDQEYDALLDQVYRGQDERVAYWSGLYPDAPVAHVSVGGVTVHQETFKPVRSSSPEILASPMHQRGGRIYFSEEGLKEFRHKIRLLMVRFGGVPESPDTLTRHIVNAKVREGQYYRDRNGRMRKKKGFELQRGDHPIGCYIFLCPWDERHQYLGGTLPPRLMAFPESVKPLVSGLVERLNARMSERQGGDDNPVMPVPQLVMEHQPQIPIE